MNDSASVCECVCVSACVCLRVLLLSSDYSIRRDLPVVFSSGGNFCSDLIILTSEKEEKKRRRRERKKTHTHQTNQREIVSLNCCDQDT